MEIAAEHWVPTPKLSLNERVFGIGAKTSSALRKAWVVKNVVGGAGGLALTGLDIYFDAQDGHGFEYIAGKQAVALAATAVVAALLAPIEMPVVVGAAVTFVAMSAVSIGVDYFYGKTVDYLNANNISLKTDFTNTNDAFASLVKSADFSQKVGVYNSLITSGDYQGLVRQIFDDAVTAHGQVNNLMSAIRSDVVANASKVQAFISEVGSVIQRDVSIGIDKTISLVSNTVGRIQDGFVGFIDNPRQEIINQWNQFNNFVKSGLDKIATSFHIDDSGMAAYTDQNGNTISAPLFNSNYGMADAFNWDRNTGQITAPNPNRGQPNEPDVIIVYGKRTGPSPTDWVIQSIFNGSKKIVLGRPIALENAVGNFYAEGYGNSAETRFWQQRGMLPGETMSDVEAAPVIAGTGNSPITSADRQLLQTFLGNLGSTVGSSLGSYFAKNDKVAGVLYSSILGELGERVGTVVANGNFKGIGVIDNAKEEIVYRFDANVWDRMKNAGAGMISSILCADLAKAIGLKGFGAELFTTASSSVLSKVVLNIGGGSTGKGILEGVFEEGNFAGGQLLMANALGAFIGSKLGAALVRPETEAAMVLSSIGSSVGVGMALTSKVLASGIANLFGTSSRLLFNFLAPGIGAFAGFVLGALIGNLFGRKKPRTPTASAETVLQVPYARYDLGATTYAAGGNINLVTNMATSARDILNGFIAQVTGGAPKALVSNVNGYSTTQAYGHKGSQLYVTVNGLKHNVQGADEAVEFGVLSAIRNTQIIGGDLFVKRAIVNSSATDLMSFSGDLTTAKDFTFYGKNANLINGYIKDAYASLTASEKQFYDGANKTIIDKILTSGEESLTAQEAATYHNASNAAVFAKVLQAIKSQTQANPWLLTLIRAAELKLDQWAVSDFYGGLKGFVDSFDIQSRGFGYENILFTPNYPAASATVSVVGGDGSGIFDIPGGSPDGATITIGDMSSVGYYTGYMSNWQATAGNDYASFINWSSSVTFDDQSTQDVYVYDGYYQYNGWDYDWVDTSYWMSETVSGGNDIFIAGQGNDSLSGRAGDDWLDGQGGQDLVYGGDGNDVLIGGVGDDVLYGGAGDDYIAAGAGNDGTYGEDGNDILVDGEGSECLLGGNGNDKFLIAEDHTFNWFWGGDAPHVNPGVDPYGLDEISAERLSHGVAFDIDYRPPDWNGHPDPVASQAAARAAIVVDAVTGTWVTSEGLFSIENATGSQYDDRIYGTSGDNALKGLGGTDQLYGRDGNDTLEGGVGADTLDGGAGFDYVSYNGSSEGVFVDLTAGNVYGGDARDDILSSIEGIKGSRLADELKGNAADNVIEAGDGDDWIIYTDGNDVYDGGSGSNTLDFSDVATWIDGAQVGLNSGQRCGVWVNINRTLGGQYVGWRPYNTTFTNVESLVGTQFLDHLHGDGNANVLEGGKGNDYVAGWAGSDTYVFGLGDGQDTIGSETNADSNTILLGSDIKFSDLWIGTAGGSSGWLTVGIRGTSDQIYDVGNFATRYNNIIKTLDMNGAGQLDISTVDFQRGGGDGNDVINGSNSYNDWILGFNGNDTITGAGNSWESNGNVIIAGLGDDVIHTSVGDDQFAYDRGDGVDTITDDGGEDTIVFGSTAKADDVIYQIVNNDLYIGLKDHNDATKTASQVADRIRVVNGGVQYLVHQTDDYYNEGWQNTYDYIQPPNTIEYVIAGGTSVDLRKLNIAWTTVETWNYNYIAPIALDLNGDGLDLSGVADSEVVVKTAAGGLSQISWVGPTDAFLAVDRDGDGQINKLSEISFTQDKPGAKSDLEGLKTWDANGDGLLDKNDANFNKLLVWVDANQNGRSTKKELRTLTEAGIAAIDLHGVGTGYTADLGIDSFVQNKMSFIWADGTKGDAYDVALARRVLGSEGLDSGGGYQAEWGRANEDGILGRLLNDPKAAAKAARIKQKKGLLDRVGASYDEVKTQAQVDFSDNDKIDPKIAKRWDKKSASEKAAWASGQEVNDLTKVKAISAAQGWANTLNDADKATKDLLDKAHQQAQAQLGNTLSSNATSTSSNKAAAAPKAANQTAGAGIAASEPLANAPVQTSANSASVQPWWQTESGADTASQTSLGSLLSAMDATPASSGTVVTSAPNADSGMTQQQLLLLQAMAGFGGGAGGSAAAVWSHVANVQTPGIAASSGNAGQAASALVAA